MNLSKLYETAINENISFFDTRIKNKAIICELDNNYYIGLNYRKMDNSVQEKEILAEELGHYYCNALYNINSDATTIRKKEYRAKKWAFQSLIPYQVLLSLKEQGYTAIYDIAEKLDVSQELVETAYNYYKENQYLY